MRAKIFITCCALATAFAAAGALAQEAMTVVRDAKTGKLRAPSAAELRALRSQVEQPQIAPTPLKSSVRPDGTRALDLGERSLVYALVTRSPGGALNGHCVQGADAAAAALHQPQGERHDER